MTGDVVAVCSSGEHRFSKKPTERIRILAGIGVEGDAHAGARVQHLSRVREDPAQPNLRQVHLIHSELFDELAHAGYTIGPGDLGENITTSGIDLLTLGRDTLLHIGAHAVLKVTGLRNPCSQIESFRPGLLKQVAVRSEGKIERKAGIMTVALEGGVVRARDAIRIERPDGPHVPLERV